LVSVTDQPSDNSASGSEVRRCYECSRASRNTKEVVHNGLQLVRVRYGLPYSELPDCEPAWLGRYLSFLLLQGKERAPVAFPRRQLSRDGRCILQRLRRHERWELAQSLSSIKRNLPAGCKRHTPSCRMSWEASVTSSPPPPSSDYLDFVRSEVSRILPACWDSDYGSFVGNHLPNASARSRKKSRADLLWAGRRSEFLNVCLRETDLKPEITARYKEVLSAGKVRPLLIPDENIDLLGPLHKCLYGALRRCPWLLCGPPTEKLMESVLQGRHQTSVDLVSATDNLDLTVTRTILDALFFTSVKVPRSIRSLAYSSLALVFEGSGGASMMVSHGQMMGTYLSFPLLCVHSYCAARWAARFDVNARFLVNGDDTVISATRPVAAVDYPSGYLLNDLKTIRAENVVELNSTTFLRRRGKWREVRHLRRGGALTNYAGMMHMASAVRSSVVWSDSFVRARIGRAWGFLPSQLGLHVASHASFKREKTLGHRRLATRLPEPPLVTSEFLMVVRGRQPTPLESEVVRSLLWVSGREGRKRDEFDPSIGQVRRTYSYRSSPVRSQLSFVGRLAADRCFRVHPPVLSVVPRDYISAEDSRGLDELDLWREAFDSLVIE